ncbi:UDP-N-acetylmuramoyl-tripeptide--D-alanyl-D-alanine ligase, partial [Enterococcus lactis]|nr:UDP-N-acetylmuramoyl-tripeptide--D-alanyl-D-alanine ligase [Enterococcus lactis]
LIGEAQIENLGSREGIAKAKMEITDGLVRDGLLDVPADEPLLTPVTATLAQTVPTFGIGTGEVDAEGTTDGKAQHDVVAEG